MRFDDVIDERAIGEKMVLIYEEDQQLIVAMEEAGEFIKATSKYLRATNPRRSRPVSDAKYEKTVRDLAEEVADLHIMLGQVPLCMDDTDAFNTMVEDIKEMKLLRMLRDHINASEEPE